MIIDRPINLRIDDELVKKFQKVAKMEDRSETAQIVYLMNKCVSEYEKQNGEV